jgi:hypothetical protein
VAVDREQGGRQLGEQVGVFRFGGEGFPRHPLGVVEPAEPAQVLHPLRRLLGRHSVRCLRR